MGVSAESAPAPNGQTPGAPIARGTVVLWVSGLGCPLCATALDKQLLKVSGVDKVKVDLGAGKVVVRLDESSRPTHEHLAEAVSRSGFTLVRIETP